MEIKIQKEFMDLGFGFPVLLTNVPMVKMRGKWTPKIDYNQLSRVMLHALCYKTSRLTGSEIKFIRHYFEMTLQQFAKRFCVTHVAILKWEKMKNRSTAMSWSTEKDIRLFVYSQLKAKSKNFEKLYEKLEALPMRKSAPLHLDVKKIAA